MSDNRVLYTNMLYTTTCVHFFTKILCKSLAAIYNQCQGMNFERPVIPLGYTLKQGEKLTNPYIPLAQLNQGI